MVHAPYTILNIEDLHEITKMWYLEFVLLDSYRYNMSDDKGCHIFVTHIVSRDRNIGIDED